MSRKRAVLVVLLMSCAAGWVAAQTLDVRSHISIAPLSIPIHPTAGATGIGMVRLGVKPQNSGETTSISQITVSMTSDGAFASTAISDIRVYFENGGNAEYDNGAAIDDVVVDTGGVHTFTGTTATIPLNPANPGGVTFPFAGGDKYLYVVFDFTNAADTTTTVGCEVTSVTYGAAGVGTGTTLAVGGADLQFILHNQRRNADTLEATMDASWIGPATAAANASKVGLLRLDFDALDSTVNATTAPVQLDTVRVHLTFGQDNWVGTAGVLLYADDGDGLFEPDGLGDGAYVASATLSGGYALLDPANIPITSAGKTYFVAVNMNGAAAQVGQSFGLNINDPSVDIVFADEIDDDAIGNAADPEYAYLVYTAAGTWEYAQKGYVVSPTADPEAIAGNTFLINPADDGNPPSVAATVPDNLATGVLRGADITVLFNEYMTESSVENPANFTISGGITPSSFTYTAGTQTLVITLPTLDWGITYTATIEGTVQDFYGNAMGTDYTWTFTVEPAQYPVVLSTSPAQGDTNIVLEPTITATFSENVSAANWGNAFKLYNGNPDTGGTEVATVSAAYDNLSYVATLSLNPPGTKLLFNTHYFCRILSAQVTDGDGLNLADQILGGTPTNKTWDFWTMPSTPPQVLSVTPAENAAAIPITSTIQVVFSKQVLASSLTGNITIVEEATASPVAGTLSPSAGSSNTATFTPAEPLDYLKQYRVTVSTGITDTEGTALSASKTWTFTTFGFTQATITNNRLGADGGASQCLIFVPQVNPTDKVSVQVFTTSGRLVRTFFKNRAFSSVTVPIPWDGTNDKGQALGPGLYFVQIIAAGVKQTLKVLIVR